MTREQLQERINKLESKIEKTEKNQFKYYDKLSASTRRLALAGVGRKWEERRLLNLSWDDEYNLDMYYTKKSELEDFTNTLNKYKNQLKALDDLIEIPVLRDFLNNWKENTIEYYIELTDKYIEKRKEIEEEYTKKGTITNGCIYYNSPFKAEYYKKCEDLKKAYGSYVVQIAYYYRRTKNEQIRKDIEKEAQNKYKKLVNRISEIVGEITNCNNLRIAGNGEINGVIEGSKGKVKITTIVAGGYNENIIVNVKHGQCAHYRVLVRELD